MGKAAFSTATSADTRGIKMMLDKKRSFCAIIGDTDNGARFLQDGKEFDADGNMIGEKEVIAEVEPARKSGRPKKDK